MLRVTLTSANLRTIKGCSKLWGLGSAKSEHSSSILVINENSISREKLWVGEIWGREEQPLLQISPLLLNKSYPPRFNSDGLGSFCKLRLLNESVLPSWATTGMVCMELSSESWSSESSDIHKFSTNS